MAGGLRVSKSTAIDFLKYDWKTEDFKKYGWKTEDFKKRGWKSEDFKQYGWKSGDFKKHGRSLVSKSTAGSLRTCRFKYACFYTIQTWATGCGSKGGTYVRVICGGYCPR